MELFGYPIETLYLYGLIIGGCLTLIYILMSDVLEGIFEVLSETFFNPTLILSFLTIFNASGYLLEIMTGMNSWILLVVSALLAFLFVTLLNVFVLIPLSSAEESNTYAIEDLQGRIGKVIISIPVDGYGEVLISGNSGNIAKSAVSLDNEPIEAGSDILIIDTKDGVLHVTRYEQETFNV
ncbi:NfeD family protein [Alkalihalobacillus sp. TS-13]|uniref:NfeD family protein n=1 Tax=Alkalihalobacillus sp. TS-13 TaxID=2842455 RepID=UPI001C875DD3|nr:NfeD family protein [Alkalihalobacillus sp. TS-13]